jgi:hypothetical protein
VFICVGSVLLMELVMGYDTDRGCMAMMMVGDSSSLFHGDR